MNMQTKIKTAPVLPSAHSVKDDAHIWRSKFIDQASKCERELRLIYTKTHTSAKPPALKTMAEAFCAESQLTEEKNKKIANLCLSLLPLIELRAHVAHSKIGVAMIDDQQVITLANASNQTAHGQLLLILSEDEQKSAQIRIASIANQLSQFRAILET